MKRKIILVAVATTVLTLSAMPAFSFAGNAQTTPVTTKSVAPAGSERFLSDISKIVKTQNFRIKAANAIISLSSNINTRKYSDAYNSLPENDRNILSNRYGIDSADELANSIGSGGLTYRFMPVNIVSGKFVKFTASSLTVFGTPTVSDLATDASGTILGAYVTVLTPGAMFYDVKSGKWDSGSKQAAFPVFISKEGKVYPAFFGPIKIVAQGTGVDVVEIFSHGKNRTSLSIGKTRGNSDSDEAKVFGNLWPWNLSQGGDPIRIDIKDSDGKLLGSVNHAQSAGVSNNFKPFILKFDLVHNKEYSIEVHNGRETRGRDILFASVKFRY